MKSVLISIRPEWVEKIVNGEKTIEVRKTAPKEVPFKCYIYCTKMRKKADLITKSENFGWIMCSARALFNRAEEYDANGKVIGEFVCDKILEIEVFKSGTIKNFWLYNLDKSCLAFDEMGAYIGKGNIGYGWHISDLKIYDKPKELSEFTRPCSYDGICFSCKRFIANGMPYGFCDSTITRPPQSYMRVEELKEV